MNKNKEKITLRVNDESVPLDMEKGFARIKRKWKKGDAIRLNLPMPLRRVLCHEKVKNNVGKVALERGPVVYCAEWPDNGGQVLNIILSDDTALKAEYRRDILGGLVVISGKVGKLVGGKDEESVVRKEQDFVAIPYYAWSHRGTGEMAVWLARYAEAAAPLLSSPARRGANR